MYRYIKYCFSFLKAICHQGQPLSSLGQPLSSRIKVLALKYHCPQRTAVSLFYTSLCMVLRWRCTVNKNSSNAKLFQSIIRFASVAFSHAPALVCFYVCKRRCSWDYDTRTFRDGRLSILTTQLHKFLGSFLLLKEFVCFRTNWLSSFSSYSKNCHLML